MWKKLLLGSVFALGALSVQGAENFSGMWILQGSGTESEIVLTEKGSRIQSQYDLLVDDPSLYCIPASVARVWANPNALIEIQQTPSNLIIRYELFDLRRHIPFGDETSLADQPSTSNLAGSYFAEMGTSFAYFEQGNLVVESRNHQPGFIRTSRGIPQSETTVAHEEFSIEEGILKIVHTYTDPEIFEKPLVLEYFFKRSDADAVALYECTDANYDWFNELNADKEGDN